MGVRTVGTIIADLEETSEDRPSERAIFLAKAISPVHRSRCSMASGLAGTHPHAIAAAKAFFRLIGRKEELRLPCSHPIVANC